MAGRVPSRGSDQFVVRFPDGMRDQIKRAADANGRSMNAEIIARLSQSLSGPTVAEVNITLDANGTPLSWDEIHEHLKAIKDAIGVSPVAMTTNIINADAVSGGGRQKQVDLLRNFYSRHPDTPTDDTQ